jgi:hypothetical protein
METERMQSEKGNKKQREQKGKEQQSLAKHKTVAVPLDPFPALLQRKQRAKPKCMGCILDLIKIHHQSLPFSEGNLPMFHQQLP